MSCPTSKKQTSLAVAQEITRYLASNPNAADSFEGIVRWWIPRQRIEESSQIVGRALELLVKQGKIVKTINSDGETIYNYVSHNTDDD